MAISKRNWIRGIRLKPDNVAFDGKEGELKVELSSAKFQAYLGGSARNIVTEDQSQTLTNKTIDVDNNTVSNIEVDNLKSGVLNTSTTLSGASDTQVPSALAVKTYADSVASTASSDLATHIADTSTHGISSAIVGISETQTLTNKTIDASLNTISNINDLNIASGGISASKIVTTALKAIATDGDGKLTPSTTTNQELSYLSGVTSAVQTQIDSKASASALTSHTGASAGVHGVTGNVVGDTDTQTLTNKTLTAPTINNAVTTGSSIVTPSRLDVKQGTKSALVTYALTASNGQIVFATDEKKMYQVVDTKLVSIGGGTASLDTVFQLVAEDQISDWSTGNNATILGGGTIAGTFVINTTSALHNSADYKYTQASGSLNDYFISAAQTVDPRFRGQQVTLYFPYTYNGSDNDIQVVFYDATNSAVIPSSSYILASSTVGMFRTNITIPSTCASIRVGFQTKVANSGKIFEFDDVQLSANTTIMAPIANQTQATYISQTSTFGNTTITGASSSSSGSGIYTYNASTGVYTVLKSAIVGVSASFANTSASTSVPVVRKGALDYSISSTQNAIAWVSTSASFDVLPGDTFTVANGSSNTTNQQRISVTATASNQNILTAPDTFSTDTASLAYSSTYTLSTLANAPVGTFITFTYGASTNTRSQTSSAPTQSISDMNQNGLFIATKAYTAASTSGNPACYAIQIGKGMKGVSLNVYKSTGKSTQGSFDVSFMSTATTSLGALCSYNESTGILVIDAAYDPYSVSNGRAFLFSDASTQPSGYFTISASKNPALTGLNISAVAARGINSSGQSIPAATFTALNWNSTKTFDTHNALGTNLFTAPESGYYQVSAQADVQPVAYVGGETVWLMGYKNGVVYSNGNQVRPNVTTALGLIYTDLVYLNKGDTFGIYYYNSKASSLQATSNTTYFSITKTSVG